jgi:hypothetical protein
MNPRQLYLDLMKKTLAYTLWPDPPLPIEAYNYLRPFWQRMLVSAASRMLGWRHLGLTTESRPFNGTQPITQDQREDGMIWPGYADTMIGLKRLGNIQDCVEAVLRDGVEGDLIETGVWRGGACIFMRAILAAYEDPYRKVYVADSFAGLPRANPEKYPADTADKHYVQKILAVSQEEVADNFRRYGLLDERVVFLKGWFQDTLPAAPIGKLAVLRLDGDMYGSTMEALTHLYPRLSPGGFCIVDDYALNPCKQAVHDYRVENRITAKIEFVDWTGVYWRKD